MYGLVTRWSLAGTSAEVERQLREYVGTESHPKFTGRPGLIEKIWTMRPGAFFAGNYIWATEQARAEFVAALAEGPSKVTQLIGREPELVEEFEIVAVAEGGEGLDGITGVGSAFHSMA
jgi:hypothetical protein